MARSGRHRPQTPAHPWHTEHSAFSHVARPFAASSAMAVGTQTKTAVPIVVAAVMKTSERQKRSVRLMISSESFLSYSVQGRGLTIRECQRPHSIYCWSLDFRQPHSTSLALGKRGSGVQMQSHPTPLLRDDAHKTDTSAVVVSYVVEGARSWLLLEAGFAQHPFGRFERFRPPLHTSSEGDLLRVV
jgi:hypothetical protein